MISAMPEKFAFTHLAEHVIGAQGRPPIKHNYRRYSPKVLEDPRESADELETKGLIQPSHSGWCNPVVMDKKSDGGFRLCIYFRRLNEVGNKNSYAMRNMSDILNKLRSAQYISNVDLSQGFEHIPWPGEGKKCIALLSLGRAYTSILGCHPVYRILCLLFNYFRWYHHSDWNFWRTHTLAWAFSGCDSQC